MAFGIAVTNAGNGDDFLPLLTYNAKAGRMKTTHRVEVNGSWETQETDVTMTNPSFVFDMENVRVGWLLFRTGMPPVKAVVPLGAPLPPSPGGEYGVDQQGKKITPRQGFVLHVMGKDRVKREFSANAAAVVGAVDELHTAYLAAPESKVGKLPVVQFGGATEIKTKHGSNYAPMFQIIGWTARPAELGGTVGAAAPQPATAPAPQPAATTAAVLQDAVPF